jgi:osmotically-inducible protein OsmY
MDTINDEQIEKQVKEELKWETGISHADIDVRVNMGIVTLEGYVSSHLEKMYAEHAASRVKGVKEVKDMLGIKIPTAFKRSDEDIKNAVERIIKWNSGISEDRLRVTVKKGVVTLTGEVRWEYQKLRAKNLAEDVSGVVGVKNLIRVISKLAA